MNVIYAIKNLIEIVYLKHILKNVKRKISQLQIKKKILN